MVQNNQPSPRKSMPVIPVDEEQVDKEIGELFSQTSAPIQKAGNADDFIATTSRTKVAIIIPLYGYWQDVPDGFLDGDVLDAALERARSYAHNAYVFLLAEPQRLPSSVAKIINNKFIAGNARGIAMPNGSSYGDYARKGMQVALTESDAQYFVFLNPWSVIQDHGVDTLIDRINIPDNAPVICGYDVHSKLLEQSHNDLDVAGQEFLKYKSSTPMEKRMLTFNFFGVNRYIAEMCPLDPNLKTQAYLERDFFQNVAARGYSAVSSERVPIFTFAFDWRQYIPKAEYDHDEELFLAKWKFKPEDITYE